MRISRSHIYVVALALALVAGAGSARALVLDWDSAAWTPGSLNNSYDLNGDGINDITVAITSQNPGIFRNDPTSGTMTPAINQTLTGGLSPVQNSLIIAADLHTNSNLTVHLSFTGTQPGASNVSFSIFDIDLTADRDIIESIYGIAPDGSLVAATVTNLGANVTTSGTGFSQRFSSTVSTPNNSSDGNITISFGSTVITDAFFTFVNSSGPPRFQDIGIGDVSFTPVPEINPAVTAAVSCFLAVGLTIFAQRRAKRRQAAR